MILTGYFAPPWKRELAYQNHRDGLLERNPVFPERRKPGFWTNKGIIAQMFYAVKFEKGGAQFLSRLTGEF